VRWPTASSGCANDSKRCPTKNDPAAGATGSSNLVLSVTPSGTPSENWMAWPH